MERNPGELKKVLIISPHFPPVNAADMHRIRQSLPYFEEFGWQAVIITVDPAYIESYSNDPLLLHTIPANTEVHQVKAYPVNITRKLGLGSLSMRSFFQIRKKGNELLKKNHFDLVYFSTTAFHVMTLGPKWKKKFGIPFILDIQDPWRNDFYLSKPKSERPPKFFISYNIDKKLEAMTIPKADGIISVSKAYCDTFKQRYPILKDRQFKVIPFGASGHDFEIMEKYVRHTSVKLPVGKINIIYIGRGGHDLKFALEIIFKAFEKGLHRDHEIFSRAHFSFIGTSYAQPGLGQKTIEPLAVHWKLGEYVSEMTDRISYFDTLFLLKEADILVVPGSTDTSYTASKIYPYILAEKPLLAVFHKNSSVVKVLQDIHVDTFVTFENENSLDHGIDTCYKKLKNILEDNFRNIRLDRVAFEPYMARSRTKEQVDFFEQVIIDHQRTNA